MTFQFPEPAITTYHCNETADKAEVQEVVWVDFGGGVDLQRVVGTTSVFKQAVHRIEDFVRNQEEPFSVGRTKKRGVRFVEVYFRTGLCVV